MADNAVFGERPWEDGLAPLEPRVLLDATLGEIGALDLNGADDGVNYDVAIVEDAVTSVGIAASDMTLSGGDDIALVEIAVARAVGEREEALILGGERFALDRSLEEAARITVAGRDLDVRFDERTNVFTLTAADGGEMSSAEARAVVVGARYENVSQVQLDTPRHVAVRVVDAGGRVAEAMAEVELTGFNDAPIIEDDPVAPDFFACAGGDGIIPSRSVAGLLTGVTIIDPEQGTHGIAVTTADTSSGRWEVLHADATDWTTLLDASSNVPRGSVIVIEGDARIRFLPDDGAEGEATISYRVWDGTDGTPGSVIRDDSGSVRSSLSTRTLTTTALFEPSVTPVVSLSTDRAEIVQRFEVVDIQHGSGTAWQLGDRHTTGDHFTGNDLRRGDAGGYRWAFEGEPGDVGIATLFNARALTIEPEQGGLVRISMSLDTTRATPDAGTVHLAVRQGSETYFVEATPLEPGSGGAARGFVADVTATDFVAIDGTGTHPDFSIDAAPLVFGFAFRGEVPLGSSEFDGGVLIDNGRFEIVRELHGGRSQEVELPRDGSFVPIGGDVDVHDGGENDLAEVALYIDNVPDPARAVLRVSGTNLPLSTDSLTSVTIGDTRFELDYDAGRQRLSISNADNPDAAVRTADVDALIASVHYAELTNDYEGLNPRITIIARDLEGNASEPMQTVLVRGAPYEVANDPRVLEVMDGGARFDFAAPDVPPLRLDARIMETDGSVSFLAREDGAALVQVGASETTIEWTVSGGEDGEGLVFRVPRLSLEHGETLTIEKRFVRGFALAANTDIRVVDDGGRLTFSSTADGLAEEGTLLLALREVDRFTVSYGNTDPTWRNDFVHSLSRSHALVDAVFVDVIGRPEVDVPADRGVLRPPYEDGPASVLPDGTTLTPGPSGELTGATVLLANAQVGDTLTIGALPDGISAEIDEPGDGIIRVRLSGPGTVAEYEAALATVSLAPDENAAKAVERVIAIATEEGNRSAEAATVYMAFDFPVTLDLGGTTDALGNAGTFVENRQPLPIATEDAAIDDPDGRTAEATIVLRNGRAGDALNVDSDVLGPLGVSAAALGNRTTLAEAGELRITLYAERELTAEEWVSALRAISFEASTMTPERVEEGVRRIEVQLRDEDGNASNVAVTRATVREVPDIPFLDLDDASVDGEQSARLGDFLGAWTEGDAPVGLTDDVFASDLDDTTFAAARVVATNRYDGDRLLLDGTVLHAGDWGGFGAIAWDVTGTATSLTIQFSGEAPIDEYRAAFEALSYQGGENPDEAVRRFTFVVDDGAVQSAQRVARIDVTTANSPPVALDDGPIEIVEDLTVTGNVLGNDFDPDGDTVRVVSFQIDGDPTAYDRGTIATIDGVGTLSIARNGEWRFVPVADYSGPVPDVTYTIADPDGERATARLLLGPVQPVQDEPELADDAYTVAADDGIAGENVTDNDVDPDGDALTITRTNDQPRLVADGSTGGTATFASDGGFTFDPAGAFDDLAAGETRDTIFTYTARDPSGTTDRATVTITVVGVDDAPVARPDESRGTEDETQVVNVLTDPATGDLDPEGEDLRVLSADGRTISPDGSVVIQTERGRLRVAADGTATFVPDNRANRMAEGETWSVTIPYVATDGTTTAASSVTVIVDGLDDPVVVIDPRDPATDPRDPSFDPRDPERPDDPLNVIPDRLDLVDGTPMPPLDASVYFADAENDPVTLALEDAPSWLAIEDGVITATPPANASMGGEYADGTYVVTLVGTTPNGDRAMTTVALRVANVPPVARDDAFSSGAYTTVDGSVFDDNGFGADADGAPDHDALEVVLLGGTEGTEAAGSNGGTFTVLPDGTFQFDPGNSFRNLPIGTTRITSLTYTIDDGTGATSRATITVTVTGENAPPTFRVPDGPPPQRGWDSDPLPPVDLNDHVVDPDGGALTFDMMSGPVWLVLDRASGVVTGVPPSDASVAAPDGRYVMTVTATDDAGQTFTFEHAVEIANPEPQFVGPPVRMVVRPTTAMSFDASQLFRDPDGDDLSFRAEGLPPDCTIDPSTGMITGSSPEAASSWTLTIYADDSQGGVAWGPSYVTIVVEPAPPTPPDPRPPVRTPIDPGLPRDPTLPSEPVASGPEMRQRSGIVLGAVNGMDDLDGTVCLSPRAAIGSVLAEPATSDSEVVEPCRGDALGVRIEPGFHVRVDTVLHGDRLTLALRHHLPTHAAPVASWSVVLDGLRHSPGEHEGIVLHRPAAMGVERGRIEFALVDGRTGAVPLTIDHLDGTLTRAGPVTIELPTVARRLAAIADEAGTYELDAERLRAAFGR